MTKELYFSESVVQRHLSSETQIELKKACQWVDSYLEIRIINTRIEKYMKYLSDKKSFDSLDDAKKYILTIKEVEEFLIVYRAFKNERNEKIIAKVKDVVSGKYYRIEGISQEREVSRDFLHELSIAARLKKSGLEVDIESECDVVTSFENRKVYIECKRVRSEEQLYKRIKNANLQIKNRIGLKKLSSCGYIVIDVTDLLTKSIDIEYFNDKKHFSSLSLDKIKVFSNNYGEAIRKRVDSKVYGVILYSHLLGVVKNLAPEKKSSPLNMAVLYAIECNGKTEVKEFNSKFLKFFL